MLSASTVSTISLTVWDTIAYYPSTGPAFSEFTDTASVAANNPGLCPKTYSVVLNPSPLTTFNLDVTTKTFQIFSGDYN